MGFTLFIVGIVIVFAIVSFVLKRQQVQAMEKYAAAQGWQALDNNGVTLEQYLPEALVNRGHSPRYYAACIAKLGEFSCAIFEYEYTVSDNVMNNSGMNGAQSNSHTYSFGVATFTATKSFKPLYLQHHTFLSNLTMREGQTKLEVEGDFNKHFDVFIPKDGQIDALSVLTPDIMAFILDNGGDYSVQIVGDKVSVFGDASWVSPVKVQTFLQFAKGLHEQLSMASV